MAVFLAGLRESNWERRSNLHTKSLSRTNYRYYLNKKEKHISLGWRNKTQREISLQSRLLKYLGRFIVVNQINLNINCSLELVGSVLFFFLVFFLFTKKNSRGAFFDTERHFQRGICFPFSSFFNLFGWVVLYSSSVLQQWASQVLRDCFEDFSLRWGMRPPLQIRIKMFLLELFIYISSG